MDIKLNYMNYFRGRGSHSVARGSSAFLPLLCYPELCLGRPCFCSSDRFLFCWAAFLSISLQAFVFPVSLLLFFLFLRPFLIHARMLELGRAFVHGHTFLYSWSGPMTLVVGLLLELRSCPIFLLFSSCLLYDLSSWKVHLLNPAYNNNNINFSLSR